MKKRYAKVPIAKRMTHTAKSRSTPLAGAMFVVAGVNCVMDQWIEAA